MNVHEIGEAAGQVFRFLESNGPASLTAIEKGTDAPKNHVTMAVGWLAREGKVDLQQDKRGMVVVLK